jgi:serine acetyltransferase
MGGGTRLGYGGIAVIIHARARIGRNCLIGSCVTIGGKSGWYEVPQIGDNVEIATGAKILGPVRIGNNVIIGANAVVTKDVPDNCVVAGIPAKIIATNVNPADYKDIKHRGSSPWPLTPGK